MCRPSRLKADAIATKARSVTNSHAWRIMVMSGGGNESVRICWKRWMGVDLSTGG
jgi:hypothetical protein